MPDRFHRGTEKKGEDFDGKVFSENWDEFFTFAFVRNPWDHFLSWYSYMSKNVKTDATFEQFVIEQACWKQTVKLWDFNGLFDRVSVDGIQVVDYVGRFENLDEDWRVVCERIGIEFQPLGKRNSSGTRKHYSHYYTDEMVDIVAGLYGRDSEVFGYTFDDQR